MMTVDDCISNILPNSKGLIVAFASLDGDMVDQHFGSAQAFFVFEITEDSAELMANKNFGIEKKDGNEDKLKPKLSWLLGCDIVYCGSIGGSATRQLISIGVTPIQVKGGPDVEELIESLQAQLKAEPEFWLANIVNKKRKRFADDDRFDEMMTSLEEESWD